MLRRLFYSFPPYVRFLVRRLYFLPYDLFHKNESICPPRGLIYTGSGDFIRQGLQWKDFFILHGFKPNDTFLDIGSGIGRIALGIKDYLHGDYDGFDAIRYGVEWCKKNISSKYANFKFQYIPLYNDLYNSEGIRAAEFVFPYDHHLFDFACAISVFTHLLPDETKQYFAQLGRVLKPSGIAVLTFFVLDAESESKMNESGNDFTFRYKIDDRYSLMNVKVKSANVAYSRKYIMSLLTENNLELIHDDPGSWCGRKNDNELAFQDIWVVKSIKK